MPEKERLRHRLERVQSPSLRGWDGSGRRPAKIRGQNAIVDCGWGRLIFGQTFDSSETLARAIEQERKGKRDIAMYLRDPHVVISQDPQGVFLDPSHTYRLWLDRYRPAAQRPRGFVVRLLNDCDDAKAIHNLYVKAHMVAPSADFVWEHRAGRTLTYLVAQDRSSGQVIGAVLGVDHKEAFEDPENGSSLWALVVDPQAARPGVGEALVRQLAEHYQARGRSFMDLSVMHDNRGAIKLYEKLGFVRVPVFALKHKNPYNEPLYIASAPEARLNPYAGILVKEARRRGIAVEVLDEEANYFSLSLGGRTIVCRESLSELTTAIAMSRCDDKAVTHRLLDRVGLRVPAQVEASSHEADEAFLERYERVVVKPARGEQGVGISVDVRTPEALQSAVEAARKQSDRVLIEEFVEGEDLRIIVINFEVVAAAVRRPAKIVGTGQHSIEELIEKQSRRRQAATGGESRIPLDAETERCIREAGYTLSDVLPYGKSLVVRKTANLHTGGTIHDVTAKLSTTLCEAAVEAAAAIDIPVVGLDFLVPSVEGDEYVIVEANERPGLANHEPAPTAERFIDLLFPQTVSNLQGAQR
jgi:GNAT-family acetyltransferase (TIGR03103 family)